MKIVKKVEMTAEEEKVILTMRDMCKEFADFCKGICDVEYCPFYWVCSCKNHDDNELLEVFKKSIADLIL